MRVGEPLQPERISLEDIVDGVFRADLILLDQLASVAALARVGDHAAVCRQDIGVLRSQT